MTLYLSSAYLAPIEYYTKLASSENVLIEKYDNYTKQTYRNRCTILSANGAMPLSIPVEHQKGEKCLTKDIRIADHDKWQHLHWNAIVSAYNSTPFFEYYRDDFYPFFHNQFEFLFDFNEQLREMICALLDIDVSHIRYTNEYVSDVLPSDQDFRDVIHPKKDWQTLDTNFKAHTYYQVFDQKFGFTPNLSIIDVLFNMGNESLILLTK